MGLLRIDLIASEGKANSITGGLVRTSIEATKLELGLASSVFESDFKKFGKLATECWITNSWKFMEEFNITMIEDTPQLALRRVGDKFIIDSFHRHGFKGKQLVRLNLPTLSQGYDFGRYLDGGRETTHHARSAARHIGHYPPTLFYLAKPRGSITKGLEGMAQSIINLLLRRTRW
jgi:hypothetical protein